MTAIVGTQTSLEIQDREEGTYTRKNLVAEHPFKQMSLETITSSLISTYYTELGRGYYIVEVDCFDSDLTYTTVVTIDDPYAGIFTLIDGCKSTPEKRTCIYSLDEYITPMSATIYEVSLDLYDDFFPSI